MNFPNFLLIRVKKICKPCQATQNVSKINTWYLYGKSVQRFMNIPRAFNISFIYLCPQQQ